MASSPLDGKQVLITIAGRRPLGWSDEGVASFVEFIQPRTWHPWDGQAERATGSVAALDDDTDRAFSTDFLVCYSTFKPPIA